MTWSMAVDLLRGGLFALAHVLGGSMGMAIVVASLAFRALLLPLSIRAARRQSSEPRRKAAPGLGNFALLPLGFAIYAAIRDVGERAGGFLWARTLARPDRAFAILGAVVAGAVSWFAASANALNGAPAARVALSAAIGASALLTVGLTLAVLSHMSAGVAVYSITSSVASFGERRLIARLAPAKQASRGR